MTLSDRARLPDAPQGLFAKFAAIQVVGGSVYLFEGVGETSSGGRGWRYDSDSGAWTKLATMPSFLALPGTFVRDGWIQVLGGMPVEHHGAVPEGHVEVVLGSDFSRSVLAAPLPPRPKRAAPDGASAGGASAGGTSAGGTSAGGITVGTVPCID